jgi:hypothetical protein
MGWPAGIERTVTEKDMHSSIAEGPISIVVRTATSPDVHLRHS